MINIVKVISTKIKNGARFIKILRYGKTDVQEINQGQPFGFDSNPTKDLTAIYAQTEEKGANVIIGYINKNQISEVGETRLFSEDANGNVVFYLHLKNDGTAEFNGAADNLVRFSELESGFNQLRDDFNNLVTIFNAHIHPTPAGPSSPTATLGTPSAAQILLAKINEIKTS